MRRLQWILPSLMAAGLMTACSNSSNGSDGGGNDAGTGGGSNDGSGGGLDGTGGGGNEGGVVTPLGDGGSSGGTGSNIGTCASPIDLNATATGSGTTLTLMGNTTGAANTLHPYGGCTTTDGPESVLKYTVPAGVTAVKATLEGSAYNSVLYARASDMCAQSTAMDVGDLACNDDSYDHAPQSSLYLQQLTAGQSVFFVVDGSAGSTDTPTNSSGAFTLVISVPTLGAANSPCRPENDDPDASTTPRCDAPNACSTGGAADGTQLCVAVAALGADCDQRGFTNTCAAGSTCVSDPSPPDGTTPTPKCAADGTAAGAPCRASGTRCDGDLVCGTGDTPICVRVLAQGAECDMTGASNACPSGQTCRGADEEAGTAATCQ